MKCLRLKHLLLGFGGLVGLFAAYVALMIAQGNFHEVIPAEFYRAAQPTAADLERYHARYGIASIINLRGANTNAPWYNEEIAAAKKLGITHFDFPMKAARELTEAQAKTLIELMKNAPKPLLIHCKSGADRTGLAAALYLAAIAKSGEEVAERQLWMHYGHMPFYLNDAAAMDRTFERLEPTVLGFTDS
jgi:uncharacterized protein (TIGR01244 family)